jgi:hypothetical protein
MTRRWTILVTALAAGMLFAPTDRAECSYLEQEFEKGREPPFERIIPPPPPPRNEISRLISRIRVGTPHAFRNATIYPLRLSPPHGRSDYRTLDESLSRGYLEILEENSPEVRSLLVRNNSRFHVFLMAGESLSGGKQNRLISENVLLRPHGRAVRVPVYCIERGRWSPGRGTLSSAGFAAPHSMRKMAGEGVSQRAMWDAVGGLIEETESRSENEDLSAVFENRFVREELGRYRREIRIPIHETVGCVAVINGRIAACDVFSSPDLFRKLRDKVLDSYFMDAIPKRDRRGHWPGPPSEHEIRRFLDRVFRASFRDRSGRDLGRIVNIAGNGIDGEGLVFDRQAVHVHLTPRAEVRF